MGRCMFSWLVSADMAIDLGTANTVVYVPDRGIVLDEPSVVAIEQRGDDQKVIAAGHAGIRILGMSIITNVHRPDRPEPISVEDVLRVANETAPKVDRIISAVIKTL